MKPLSYIDDIQSEISRLRRVIVEIEEDSKGLSLSTSEKETIRLIQGQIRKLDNYVQRFDALEKECEVCMETFPY